MGRVAKFMRKLTRRGYCLRAKRIFGVAFKRMKTRLTRCCSPILTQNYYKENPVLSIKAILCDVPMFAMSILFLLLKLVEHIEIYALQYLIFLGYFFTFYRCIQAYFKEVFLSIKQFYLCRRHAVYKNVCLLIRFSSEYLA